MNGECFGGILDKNTTFEIFFALFPIIWDIFRKKQFI